MPVYLELFNGRHHPEEELDDWGFDGPVLGPLPFVQITYKSYVRLGYGLEQYKNLEALNIDTNGYILFAGGFYGDMSIVSSDESNRWAPNGILVHKNDSSLRKRVKETQKVFQTDPALLIKDTREWVKLYAEWRFKNDTTQPHPNLRETPGSHPGKPSTPRKRTHAKPGRGRRKNI